MFQLLGGLIAWFRGGAVVSCAKSRRPDCVRARPCPSRSQWRAKGAGHARVRPARVESSTAPARGQSSSVCSALTGSAGSVSGHGSAYRPPSPRPPGTSGGSEASAQQSPGKGCSRRSVPSAVRPEGPGVVVPAVARPAGAITSNFTGWMCWPMVSVRREHLEDVEVQGRQDRVRRLRHDALAEVGAKEERQQRGHAP